MAKVTPLSQVSTTFTGKDIRTVLSVYQYTVTTTGFHVIAVKAVVAGNGVYTIYLTRQWLGSGNVSTLEPKTLIPVASGETLIQCQTMPIYLIATDVVQIMMLGLTGDNAASGSVSIAVDNFSVFDPAADTVASANLTQILGTALTETSGLIAAAFKKFFNIATPTGTVNSLPDAVPGANGGLPTTNGTKVNQTVDLTAGQTVPTVTTVTNTVNADVKKINGTSVTGNGSSTPWGPA